MEASGVLLCQVGHQLERLKQLSFEMVESDI
jgi:hypothetical protein